jgi:hypothetical protein
MASDGRNREATDLSRMDDAAVQAWVLRVMEQAARKAGRH